MLFKLIFNDLFKSSIFGDSNLKNIMMFTPAELLEINTLLTPENKIVILTHYNPDGDAIGSSLGLKHYLNAKGIAAEVLVPNDFPKFLKWMPGARKNIVAEYKRKIAFDMINEADVIFCLDFNSPSRIGILGDWLVKATAKKILIDHHQQPEAFDYVYSDTIIPATSQMIYHFIEAMDDEALVDKDIAECLYTGIMTDTGGFRFRSTSATTHRIIANLIEKGADPSIITSNTWDTNTVSRLHLLALILGRIEVVNDGTVAILYLTRKELQEYGFQKGDTEGFVNYGLSIIGVKMSAFFMEDLYEDFIKISFRSKDDVDVNQFSRKYFSGGGHINAAGGKSNEPLSDTLETFKTRVAEENL
jgi:phosphoesterase RecJ-like protein